MTADAIICDIDGTLADCTHRLSHIAGKPKDWGAFFGAMDGDAIIEPIRDLLHALAHVHPVVLCSGRPANYRAQTLRWLTNKGVPFTALYMRKPDDRRDDDIVKAELLAKIIADGWKPLVAIEDRKRVVDMWRANGIMCLQCAPGEF